MSSELCFRAQSLIPEQRELFDYWRCLCGRRRMPARAEIAPADIRHLLPRVGLIDIEPSFGQSVVRLAGSALRDIYGCELTGKCLGEIDWGERSGYWRDIHRRLVQQTAPLQGTVRGPAAEREHVTLSWLRLPLSDDGLHVNKALCYDIALSVPRQRTYHAPIAMAVLERPSARERVQAA